MNPTFHSRVSSRKGLPVRPAVFLSGGCLGAIGKRSCIALLAIALVLATVPVARAQRQGCGDSDPKCKTTGILILAGVGAVMTWVFWKVAVRPKHVIVALTPNQEAEWRALRESGFPARVQAIVFDNNVTLERGRSVTWSRWSVRLADSPIVTDLDRDKDIVGFQVPTVCTNAVGGTVPCKMSIYRILKQKRPWCFVSPSVADGSNTGSFQTFDINCPIDVRFDN